MGSITCTGVITLSGVSGSPPASELPPSPAAPGPAAQEAGSYDGLFAPQSDPQSKSATGGQERKEGGQLGGCQWEELRRQHEQ